MDRVLFCSFILLFCTSAVFAAGGSVHYESHDDTDPCSERMKFCMHEHISFVSYGLIPAMSKETVKGLCEHEMEHMNFDHCMTMEGFLGNCSEVQKLKFEGAKVAMMYVCEGGYEDDLEGDYTSLMGQYVEEEDGICHDQFFDGVLYHLSEALYYDSLPTPEEVEDKDALEKDIKDEKKYCCGYLEAYIGCYEGLVERQADEDLKTYQYEMLVNYFEPIIDTCECTIEKGISQIFINALLLVGILLIFIFGLAALCGCLDCCGERMKLCRRRCRQVCYCCYDFEEDDEYFERKYEAKLTSLYGGDENRGYNGKV